MPESQKEQTDRQLIELLNELRVALPGAQVLLGFLLTAPLATRFGLLTSLDRAVLYACTLVTAAGVLFLMAPSVVHRMRWNTGGKGSVVRAGHRLFLAGTACLAAGLLCAVFLIGDLIYGLAGGIVGTVLSSVIVGATWYALPLRLEREPHVGE